MNPTVVIGVGNPWRGDDGAGPAVVAAAAPDLPLDVRVLELDGEPARLVQAWTGARLAVVVDAVRTGAAPGTVHRWDTVSDLPAWSARQGSHGVGLAGAVALGRALDRLPSRLVLVGVEASPGTDLGDGLSEPVAAALDDAVRVVAGEIDRGGA